VQVAAGVSLLSEGFEMIDTDAIIGSFARHLMTAFDRWNEHGSRRSRGLSGAAGETQGRRRRTIDLNGDLLVGPPSAAGRPTAPVLWMRSPG